MNHGDQEEFLFCDDAERVLGLPRGIDSLLRDIGREWGLPVGERVRVSFRSSENFRELLGRLEVAAAPELPFNRHRPLRLRVNGYEFPHTALARCVVVEPTER
ncbi:MAG TPA: hypothetical protein PK322_02660 [Opitutaceae bacterium]|nr:hypothetical protein [Opitutaceae bacterium]